MAYDYYVNGVTSTGFAAWKAPGTPDCHGSRSLRGALRRSVDPAFDIGNFPVDCWVRCWATTSEHGAGAPRSR